MRDRTDITLHTIEGASIAQRADGYVNATAMCRAHGKKFNHYASNAVTKTFIAALSANTGIPAMDLMHARRGGSVHARGTWVHPLVAVNLAQWLSPAFAVAVSRLVLERRDALAAPAAPSLAPDGRVVAQTHDGHTVHLPETAGEIAARTGPPRLRHPRLGADLLYLADNLRRADDMARDIAAPLDTAPAWAWIAARVDALAQLTPCERLVALAAIAGVGFAERRAIERVMTGEGGA